MLLGVKAVDEANLVIRRVEGHGHSVDRPTPLHQGEPYRHRVLIHAELTDTVLACVTEGIDYIEVEE